MGGGELSSSTTSAKLTSPVAIAGFEGWNDAGEAASGVVNHLGIAWQATPIGAIDPEDFYDFQVNRPVIEIEGGQTQRLIWPTTRISSPAPSQPTNPRPPPGCPATWSWCTASSRTCAGGRSARSWSGPGEPRRQDDHPARRAARRRAAHPPGAGFHRLVGRQARHRDRRGPVRLQGPDRDRRRAAAHLHPGGDPDSLAVGAGAALRGAAAEPEGHAGAAARRGGHPGRTAAAGRPARGGARLGARRGRARPAGLRGRRLRAHPGRGQGRDGPARSERRRDRPRVRALLRASPGTRGGVCGGLPPGRVPRPGARGRRASRPAGRGARGA